jgi:hypothetical protein
MDRISVTNISGHSEEGGGSCLWTLARDLSRTNSLAGLLTLGLGLPATIHRLIRTT